MKRYFYVVLLSLAFVPASSGRNMSKVPTNLSSGNFLFVANTGQITDQHFNLRKDIDYKLNAPGMDIFVGDGEIHYQFTNLDSKDLGDYLGEKNFKERGESINLTNPGSTTIYRLDVSLIGANKNAEVIAEEKADYHERYYLGHTRTDGNIAYSYRKITYKEIYPNIDWVLYVNNNELKYDFVVRPGGKVSDIQLKYEGATSLHIKEGALTASTPFGSITEQTPYSYEASSKKEVASRYALEDNVLSFETGSHEGTLVIDPTLQWGTYYGGSNTEEFTKVSASASNVCLVGQTKSTANIATVGAFQTTIGWSATSGETGFLAAFNHAGTRLWCTYVNGVTGAIAHDRAGMIYIGGGTGALTNIGTPGTHQPIYTGNSTAFLMKFDAAGQRIWGTYYADSSNIGAITIYGDNEVYIGGVTSSSTGIGTPGSHQPVKPSSNGNAFIAKFNSSGIRQWGSYYGGNNTTTINRLAADQTGAIYATGWTHSNTGIATGGSHQTVGNGQDAFLVKFTSAGLRQWGTYYSGGGTSLGFSVATDVIGNVYLCGLTPSATGIATPGSHRPVKIAGGEGFLVKFNGLGVRQWGTYYDGGPTSEGLTDVTTDQTGNIYVAGGTHSTNVATPGGHQQIYGGVSDATLSKFNTNGQLLWGTYYGGSDAEGFNPSVSLDTSGNIYLTGTTHSSNAIATPGSHKPSFTPSSATDNDAFLAKFVNEDTVVYIHSSFNQAFACAGDSIFVPYGITHFFRTGNTFRLQLSDAAGSFAVPVTVATANTNAAGILAGVIPSVIPPGLGYRIRVVASGPMDTSFTKELAIRLKPAKPTATSNTPLCVGSTITLSGSSATPGVNYSWTGPIGYSNTTQNPTRTNATVPMGGNYILKTTLNGCTSEADTAAVVVVANPAAPVAGNNGPLCAGTTLNLTATGQVGATYQWNGPGGFNTTVQNPSIANVNTGHAGNYVVTQTVNGCTSVTGSTTAIINNAAMPTVTVFPNPNDSVCPGAQVTFVAVQTNGGTPPTYRWFKNTLLIPGATAGTYQTSTVSTGDVYSVEMTSTQLCAVPAVVNSSNVVMTVVPPVVPSVTITASPGLNVGPWTMVTFTATPVNGGTSPIYQWLRNGQPVIGAISSTWGAANLSDNDVISVVLFSSEVCAIPPTDTSNVMTVRINTGIDNQNNHTTNLQLYPNPNNGSFTVKGSVSGGDVTIEVVNAIGQVVYSEQLTVNNEQLDCSVNLHVASGVYLLRVSSGDGVETLRFSKE